MTATRTNRKRILRYLNEKIGIRMSMTDIARGAGLPKPTVKRELQELVNAYMVTKHPPHASGITHWSIQEDTAPEKRPLSKMLPCGSILSPPNAPNSKVHYHQSNAEASERYEDEF